jgi:hypothetical protein
MRAVTPLTYLPNAIAHRRTASAAYTGALRWRRFYVSVATCGPGNQIISVAPRFGCREVSRTSDELVQDRLSRGNETLRRTGFVPDYSAYRDRDRLWKNCLLMAYDVTGQLP